MIRNKNAPGDGERGEGAGPGFLILWATGSDPGLDGLFRLLAMRPNGAGGWEVFDRICDPFPDSEADGATARMAREFGVTRTELGEAVAPREAWAELQAFLAGSPLVTLDSAFYEAWAAHLGEAQPRLVLGLDELVALLLPGRLATRGEELLRTLTPPSGEQDGHPRAHHPTRLHAALTELVGRFLARDGGAVQVAARGWAIALDQLRGTDPAAADRLDFALRLVDHPSQWCTSTGGLFSVPESIRDGCLSAAQAAAEEIEALVGELCPACQVHDQQGSADEEIPAVGTGPLPMHPEDLARLDDLFEVHIPALLAQEFRGAPSSYYRSSQHRVAGEVASTLGGEELLLVHAPTGTGKTLAYLLPAMLWSRRHGVRVGIATYTRALQEQAMDREVPRALSALARVGILPGTRVSVLKGRENYLCFRALRLASPEAGDGPEEWLAWTALVLFSLTDPDGDLDRFPRRAPIRMTSSEHYRNVAARLLSAVRARSGCCLASEDRGTCAAELARRRAERSHVVLTNQSLALAREELFRHLIVDECEHLHDVAHSTWSRRISLARARELLRRLHLPQAATSKRPLDRLHRALVEGTGAGQELRGVLQNWEAAATGLGELEREALAFERWRDQAARSLSASEEHSLFRSYVGAEEGRGLIEARCGLSKALGALEAGLDRLLEHVEPLGLRGLPRMRRTIDLTRAGLTELGEALLTWLPLEQGESALSRELFYDVERDGRHELLLSARVLLPNEYLGRHYYPNLQSACLLSATTHLSKGFEPAIGFLGLDRAVSPAEEEERPGQELRTFSAPELFDYSRVLVGVPGDAPTPRNKGPHLDYLTRFIDWLGERTRGRMLVLFTNLEDVRLVGERLAPLFRKRHVALWYQGMDGVGKEELGDLFRGRTDSVLLGVDTFWYGADFPGETLEYLLIARLPYGVPDRYHHAQAAVMGKTEARRKLYMPRALAKLRQGFGRLMRRTSDRGCVFLLDPRVIDARHRAFLKELPIQLAVPLGTESSAGCARLVRGDSGRVLREALAHMDMLADLRRRGLSCEFAEGVPEIDRGAPETPVHEPQPEAPYTPTPPPARVDVALDDLPF